MTGSHLGLPVILHYLLMSTYGVVVGGVGMGVGTVLVFGSGKMNWFPLGINIVCTPGASFKMYWYCKISGFC